jgi:DNA-binding Lrp family transcriptional regulator
MDLDRFDRLLLNLLQEDAGQTAERLADRVGLSPSAIQRRIRRLREHGVIVRDTAILDPKKVGSPSLFIVGLQVERERPEMLSQLREALAKEDNVQQIFYVTGEADFILVVVARNTAQFDEYMSALVRAHPNIKRFTTSVVLNTVKQGLSVPVPID